MDTNAPSVLMISSLILPGRSTGILNMAWLVTGFPYDELVFTHE